MILKIKKFISKIRIFERLRVLSARLEAGQQLIERFREESYNLKGQLMDRRKTIKDLNEQLLKAVNDLNLLAEKKKKGEIYIAELKKRRDEFLNRLSAIPDASIANFDDYKFWLSLPFIVDKYKVYKPNKDDIDGVSAIRGLGMVFDKIDEKK